MRLRTPPRVHPDRGPGHQCGTLAPARDRQAWRREAAVAAGAAPCWLTCTVHLDPAEGAYAGVPAWNGRGGWLVHAASVFAAHYPTVRRAGDELSLHRFLAVCQVMSVPGVAEPTTGRGARLSVATIAQRAGVSTTVVERSRRYLTVLGLGTEVFCGRHKSFDERIQAWLVGDTSRGWTSVWALHPRRRRHGDPPVDNPPQVRGMIQRTGGPPTGNSFKASTSPESVVSSSATHPAGSADGTPNRTSTKGSARVGPTGPGGVGLGLSKALRAQRECPGWIRRYSPHTYASALTRWAEVGWTAHDVLQHLNDLTGQGLVIYDQPRNPVKYLLSLLYRADLNERPTVMRDAHAAYKAEQAARRRAAVPGHLAAQAQAREVGRAALNGEGRQQVRQALAQRATTAAMRRAARNRAEADAAAALIARARRPR